MNLRDETLTSLREQGLQVFPLKDKRPAVTSWQNYNGNVKEDQSFGIILGSGSKIFVIDVDDYSLLPDFIQFLDKTYVVKTGKGFHIFVKANVLPNTMRLNNNQGQHIDLQSTGTYVVGETSEHYDKNSDGIYVKTGKIYEKISNSRTINWIDFETDFKPILKKLGFDMTKKPIKEELADAIKNGLPKGNRNNVLFKLACHLLTTINDETIVYNLLWTINQKNDPIDKEEFDSLFASAIKTVKEKILQSNQKFKIDKKEIEILDVSPQELFAITLDASKTRLILVYLQSKATENSLVEHKSMAFIIQNGAQGKSILPLEDESFKEHFITNLYPEFSILTNRWKFEDIQKFLSSNEKVNPKELFENLIKYERKYFENEYDYDYYYELCWITHTYFYTLFEKTPYNDYFGMKNVGKSKRLNSLRMLCYNGILSGDSSVSSTFRTIQGTGSTLLLDETENLGGKKDDRADMENLLRNGFDREGKIIRSKVDKKNDFIPEIFHIYSPKAFGHINGLDNVLEDRAIRTKLTRTTNKKIADSEPDEKEDSSIYQIRESLYRLFLDYGQEVSYLIPEAKSLMSEVSGRELKLWLPIVTIALFYEKHGVEGLIKKITAKMLHTSEDKKISDLEGNSDFKILQVLEQTDTIPITSRQLYHMINEELEKQFNLEPINDKSIKESLERLGFRNKRTSKAVEWTNINKEKIKEAKERIGLVKPTQATLVDVDCTHENVGNVGSVAN